MAMYHTFQHEIEKHKATLAQLTGPNKFNEVLRERIESELKQTFLKTRATLEEKVPLW
jgi:hypothetical protein